MDSVSGVSSIDHLLASSAGETWDIDREVHVLRAAAAPVARQDAAPGARKVAIVLPAPFELAPALEANGENGAHGASKKIDPDLTGGTVARRAAHDAAHPEALLDLLRARIDILGAAGRTSALPGRIADPDTSPELDKIGLARAHIEMSVAAEMLRGDDALAIAHAQAALRVDPRMAAAHALLRRKCHGRAALPAMLEHLENELAASTEDGSTIELLVEKARLLDARGESPDFVRSIWEQARARAPHHPAALKGLEADLTTRAYTATSRAADDPAAYAEAYDVLARHLASMAEAYASEPKLAAWLHAERAQILEFKLYKVEEARAALERAVALDPSVGPVRDEAVRHVASHDDPAALCLLLQEEAELETDPNRAARLELDAACIAYHRLNEPERAIGFLQRAAARAPTSNSVDRRVLDELVRLHEQFNDWAEAARARRARLRFLVDPLVLTHELRMLARIDEQLGEIHSAIEHTQAALAIEPRDITLLETLDRLLSASSLHEQRVDLWVTEAARAEDAARRARALVRAAQIAEHELAKPGTAVEHLRAAWVVSPGDPEVLEALARLLAPATSEATDREARAVIDLYAQAVELTKDPGRKVSSLEKIALLCEELLGDVRRAARTYEQILRLEPDRRGAVLGLARTATKIGDDRALARALLDEARLATERDDMIALRVRAIGVLARVDRERALALLDEVLAYDPTNEAARALETRFHAEAGRWERAAASLKARIQCAPVPRDRLDLWLELAQIQELRLRSPKDAMVSLSAARAIDPNHPVPPDEIVRMLEATGDYVTLRDAMETLANDCSGLEDRARYLVRAAEIDEHRLANDERAATTYARALAETPEDELIAERLERAIMRHAVIATAKGKALSFNTTNLLSLQVRRLEHKMHPASAARLSFGLAQLYLRTGRDIPQATKLLEIVLEIDKRHIPALRTLEGVSRRTNDWARLAHVLSRQGDVFSNLRARLGALWHLASLEEWRQAGGDPLQTYQRILQLDPTEPGALYAIERREMASARKGDKRTRKTVLTALRSLHALASDEGTRRAIQLRLALILENAANDPSLRGTVEVEGITDAPMLAMLREALDRYRTILAYDPLSVAAATGIARIAPRLADVESAVTAAISLADLSILPSARARYLIDAAELLLGPVASDVLGSPERRTARAADLLEKALSANPDSVMAAGRLATVRRETNQSEQIVEVFRQALKRARAEGAIVLLGAEIARVAREKLGDLPLGIAAMRRVREAAPNHISSLLTLAELCVAQRTWPEAVDALESVVALGREPGPRLTALFSLSSIYEHVMNRPSESERTLRTALALDPLNARALRGVLRHITAQHTAPPELETGVAFDPVSVMDDETRTEVADLVERLARVEEDPEQRCELLLKLADLRMRLGDPVAVERALVEAVARTPASMMAFGRLSAHFRTSSGRDHVAFARALMAVIARGREVGVVDARWLATLGQLEIESLQRLREGIGHLQQAVQLNATMHETRFELARALARANANDEAARHLLGMVLPTSAPLLALSEPPAAIALLERTLQNDRRMEEALVVSELRAVAGDVDEGRLAWLRSRRLIASTESQNVQLDRPTIVTHVLPVEGRHVLLEVAAAVAGIESKILRADLSELGITSRDRVSSRSGHPTRVLFDRVLRTLGMEDLELVISPSVTRTRVLAQDTLWIVVPKRLSEMPEPAQLASIARALTRASLGVPWLEELPPPHIEGLLIACARQVVHGYGADELDVLSQKLVAQYEPNVARAMSRKQKKVLEELGPHLAAPQGRPIPVDGFISALARAEMRATSLITGDLLATLEELCTIDPSLARSMERFGAPALAAVLEHSFGGDVARFALSGEAIALRRRIGTTWTT
ncbi:hypothetical protein [Pendulispora albinea]|uniref:Tetratricopeptide repeat protein n=1 Tax=Pendulispora albinea TaxID=2741071 RepID=A0ABZ2M4R5_9BACT